MPFFRFYGWVVLTAGGLLLALPGSRLYSKDPDGTPPKVYSVVVVDFSPSKVSKSLREEALQRVATGLWKTGVFQVIGQYHVSTGGTAPIEQASRWAKSEGAQKVVAFSLISAGPPYVLEIFGLTVGQRIPRLRDRRSLITRRHLLRYLEEFAFQLAEEYYTDEKESIFFRSFFVPGLGQFLDGQKVRGLLFFSGVVGMSFYVSRIGPGDLYTGGGRVLQMEDTNRDGEPDVFYIGRDQVTPEKFYAERDRRRRAEESRDQKKRERRIAWGIMGVIYMANLVDAIFTGTKYDRRYIRQRRFSLLLAPNPQAPMVTFCWKF